MLDIDKPAYVANRTTATAMLLRVSGNIKLYTYDVTNDNMTEVLDGTKNGSCIIRTNSTLFNRILANGLLAMGATINAEAKNNRFFIGVTPVTLYCGYTQSAGAVNPIEAFRIGDTKGKIRADFRDVFDLKAKTTENTDVQGFDYTNLMLPGQTRTLYYNKNYKLAQTECAFTVKEDGSPATPYVTLDKTTNTITAKQNSPYDAITVRVCEKFGDQIYRIFDKKCTVFSIGLRNQSDYNPVHNPDGTISIEFLPESQTIVPVELRNNGKIRIHKTENISILDNNGNSIFQTTNVAGQGKAETYVELNWQQYKEKIIDNGNIRIRMNSESLASLGVSYLPNGIPNSILQETFHSGDNNSSIFPNEDTLLSADEENIELYAGIGSFQFDGDKIKTVYDGKEIGPNSRVRWTVITGSGHFDVTETSIVDGMVENKFYPSSKVNNSTYQVQAEVIRLELNNEIIENPGIILKSGIIRIVPGNPADIDFALNPSRDIFPADGVSRFELDATIRDAHNNVVPDIGIFWFVNSGEIDFTRTTKITNTAGLVHCSVIASKFTNPDKPQTVTLDAGSYKKSFNFNLGTVIPPPITSSRPSLTIENESETATLTARFPGVPAGTAVKWYTTNGKILSSTPVDNNSQSTALLSAAEGRVGYARVGAGVGSVVKTTKIPFSSNSQVYLEVEKPVIAGDLNYDCTQPFEYLDEYGHPNTRDIDIASQSVVTIHGRRNSKVFITGIPIQKIGMPVPDRTDPDIYMYATGQFSADGSILLDDFGIATFRIQSYGVMETSTYEQRRRIIHHNIIARIEQQAVAKKVAGSGTDVFMEDVAVVASFAYGHTFNIAKGFIGWGDIDGVDVMAGDFVASMIIWGDLRDLLMEFSYSIVPGSNGRGTDLSIFSFAAAGLAMEFLPGIGEGVDAIFASIKELLKITPPGPFRDFLASTITIIIEKWKKGESLKAYLKEMGTFLNELLLKNLNHVQEYVNSLSRILISPDLCETLVKLVNAAPSKNFTKFTADIATKHGDDLARKVLKSLDGIDPKIINEMTEEQMTLLVYHLKNIKKDDVLTDAVKKLINNKKTTEAFYELSKTRPALLSIFYKRDELITKIRQGQIWDTDDKIRGQLAEHYRALTDPALNNSNVLHIGRLDNGYFKDWDFYDKATNTMINQKSVRLP